MVLVYSWLIGVRREIGSVGEEGGGGGGMGVDEKRKRKSYETDQLVCKNVYVTVCQKYLRYIVHAQYQLFPSARARS